MPSGERDGRGEGAEPRAEVKTGGRVPLRPERAPDPCTVVVFGASGDLAHRKVVPALYELAREGALPDPFTIVGFARSQLAQDRFRAGLREAAERFARRKPLEPEAWERLADRIEYEAGGYDDPAAFRRLGARLARIEGGKGGNRLFYLATPPEAFVPVLEALEGAGLVRRGASASPGPWSRVIVEKPFGRDLESARALNGLLGRILEERQIFRIDHYLGKETVQNLLVLRFGNAIFEPLWNRKYVDHVQITAAEEIGVGGRGGYYDGAGALRDVVQNHLLQVLALCAMEPPISFAAEEVRSARVQALRSLRPIRAGDVARETVFGQYRGYRSEPGVARDSRTPTYAALRVYLDNWRWQGVPFYLRAGKRLARRATEVAIQFQSIPLCLFGEAEVCRKIEPNVLVVRVQPDEGIALSFASKVPGEGVAVSTVAMDFSYARGFDVSPADAYERLLLDAMRGDPTLFARQDDVEEAWKFVTPILEAVEREDVVPAREYEPGTAGPREADELLLRDGRTWRSLA
jgi:glucose-6-phosphate 1-dehydrogenase